ncbi:hypothetical protein ACQKWADRAFT_311818 [Trichoderma austrokoningii]
MSVPAAPFRRLTLKDMSSPTSLAGPSPTLETIYQQRPLAEDSSSDYEPCSDISDDDGDDDEDDDDDDELLPAIVQSPSNLSYTIDHLPEESQDAVRRVFDEPPAIALQQCRLIDDTYAFQMTELVTQSVRIRAASGDGSSSQLTCSCGHGGGELEPCSHLIWLLDQLAKQTLYDYDPKTPLTMTEDGFAQELGDPFTAISEHRLDVLSDGLHCPVVGDDDMASCRVQESRELVAAVYGVPPEEFRPDIFDSSSNINPLGGKKVLRRNDLDFTVLRMLLDNHHFFNYFQSQSRPRDPISDLFRKLSRRVDRVLRVFDTYASDPTTTTTTTTSSTEPPPDVTWAAKHILGCTKLIKSCIYTRDRPLQPSEATSAARALVHILAAVVSRNQDVDVGGATRTEHNLYLHLIGNRDTDLVIAELSLLPEAASQHLHSLEAIFDDIGRLGAPVSYFEKFKSLLSRLRTPTMGSGLKRQAGEEDSTNRHFKRMK